MRLVLDTNIFISGIFWEGNFCSQIIEKWKKKEIDLISSPEIIEEFINTLRSFRIQMPEDMIEEWKNVLINNSIIVNPSLKIEAVREDSEDNKFLEAAVSGKADFIISQDNHLLNLKEYEGIRIIKPEEAIEILDRLLGEIGK